MDTWEGWEEKKDKEKNDRYNSNLVFMNDVTLGSAKWTVGLLLKSTSHSVLGAQLDNFFNKLLKLGVEEARHRE